MDKLLFDPDQYEVKSAEFEGRSITYRAFEQIPYCEHPVSRVQVLNLYAPEGYYHGERINGYTLKTAPIFVPNTVGGYKEGPAMTVSADSMSGRPNSAFEALMHGYVVLCAGIRGRNTDMTDAAYFERKAAVTELLPEGSLPGRAPALIVDMKAAIRYIRHNADRVPGNVERMITNGTSAGGALSSLAGATGNAADYEPYLQEIGAASERDDVFAASCYCPIHNLEHADMAYEWLFHQETTAHTVKFECTEDGVRMLHVDLPLTEAQMELSEELRAAFPAYVNGLNLKDSKGNPLTLDAEGEGTFQKYVMQYVLDSASREKETHDSENRLQGLAVPGSEIDRQNYLSFTDNTADCMDWEAYIRKITRMKPVPSFDTLELASTENEEFGDDRVFARHFTECALRHSLKAGEMADPELVKLLNPTLFIGTCDTAPHWRIRHGAFDRDTSLAIPVILATLLENRGYQVDFALPWGIPHSGDYDLAELFAWIDSIV